MVKNSGGNKCKKFGRKFMSAPVNRNLRLVKDDDEQYACVTKMLGNNSCHVVDINNKQRYCVIRNKFSGRNKRNNMLRIGAWVMVGIRSWAGVNKTFHEHDCDILEVYTDGEMSQLRDKVNVEWKVFDKYANIANSLSGGTDAVPIDNDEFVFTTDEVDEELEDNIKKEASEVTRSQANSSFMDDVEFNIDDI